MLLVTDNARAFWIAEAGRGEIRTEPLPPAQAGDVVVRALYSGISRGTEALVFQGRVPQSEFSRMRAPFQAGEFPHRSNAATPASAKSNGAPAGSKAGAFVLYPHQTR
jgi:hypothetical protein